MNQSKLFISWGSNDQKLLGVSIDWNLKFSHYILKQCKKAGRKLSVFTRIRKFTSLKRRRVLVKSFIESQFAYCPLVWMCREKTSYDRMYHLHERALRTVYNDDVSTFEKLLEKDNSITIQVRNLRILAIELYKTKENLAVLIMRKIFNSLTNWYSVGVSKNSQLWFKGSQIFWSKYKEH